MSTPGNELIKGGCALTLIIPVLLIAGLLIIGLISVLFS
ncbi:MAG: hypothetical protein JWQ74_2383 [Marmoricola sp.]|nr:hypothetical protein [Marmoricola sp.]